MMQLLAPLGFLGLLSLVVLIVIYLIRPNYQQKVVSSTFIWERALRYRKKRIPVSRFRNIIILICQILILALCSWLMAGPVIAEVLPDSTPEKIAVIDASGSMRATDEGETRFERAVDAVRDLADDVFNADGVISVIVADGDPYFIAQRFTAKDRDELYAALAALLADDRCSYGSSDIDAAMDMAQTVLDVSSEAEVLLYTGTRYYNKGTVTVVDVSESGEWNVAVTNCVATMNENYYTFDVDVACYGRDTELWIYLDVYGANVTKETVNLSTVVRCTLDKTQTVSFVTVNTETPIYSYESVHVHVNGVADALAQDNDFYLFGGTKPSVKVQYASPRPNSFFAGWLLGAREVLGTRWSIELTEATDGTFETSGYDFYIFEHAMPDTLPQDGVVLLVDLDRHSNGLYLTLGNTVTGDFMLTPGVTHQATQFVTAENVSITEYKRITAYDERYFQPLMYCGGDPVYLVCNQPNYKVAVLSLNLNKSNLSVLVDFPILMYNLFNYYLPSTITSAADPTAVTVEYVFDAETQVTLNAWGNSLAVTGPELNEEFTEFPDTLFLHTPGVYMLQQNTLRGQTVVESFYVKLPADESNIVREVDVLKYPLAEVKTTDVIADLVLYFAIALIVLLFVEWILQALENFR